MGCTMQCERNLSGKICPYPVVETIREVEKMRAGETLNLIVDDPLAIKSIPYELREYPDISVNIEKISQGWKIQITKR
ncbi:MAG: sulfurtransferase TusA family protein [Candidatus Thermoplasmatota archaeon]|nr:sulfurtransferase TusA family protein [Candidatus Thermoplasmatota archaeon]